jgi:hypothetical protein
MTETKAEKVELTAAAPVAQPEPEPTPAALAETLAPAALAEAPVAEDKKDEEKEPTMRDVVNLLNQLLGYMKDDKEEDLTAPAVVEAAAKTELTTLSRIEKDAAGAAPVPAQPADSRLSRTEILNQFNQEKHPAKRVELLRKLGL